MLMADRLLLALLLQPLDLVPDQIPRFALQLDSIALIGVVELEQVLDFPDVGQGATQHLQWARLLLTLLLITLRHRGLLTTYRPPAHIRVYPVRGEVRHREYLHGSRDKFTRGAVGA
jgi:hypothetical protein